MEYSRQLYVIGKEAMSLMENSSVLIVGMNGLGTEIAKNIILCGVKQVSVYDRSNVTIDDISYYTTENDIGKNKAETVINKLKELNTMSKVNILTENPFDEEIIKKYTVVVLVEKSLTEQLFINEIARKYNIKFISCGAYGTLGQIFCDFGDFVVCDQNDEGIKSGIISEIKDNIVTCVENHGLSRNDKINIRDKIYNVQKVTHKTKFMVNDVKEIMIESGDKFTQVKESLQLKFKPLKESLEKPNISIGEESMHKTYLKLLNDGLYDMYKYKLVPMQSVIGAIVSQEVLKAITTKFTPIFQSMYFTIDSGTNIGCNEIKTNSDIRYCGQINIFGKEIQEKINKSTIFVVGSGAIGCEHLKNFAMMGFNLVTCDMDTIEKSNLCRQFLFRNSDINKSKSVVAAREVKLMNPHINVQSYQNKICKETLNIFNEEFFDSITIVAGALDNVSSRVFIDKLCVSNKIPLLEAGTMGTKANVQCIIPNLTESYSSMDDPEEKAVPACTLKHFPYLPEHTIQCARDLFEGLFVTKELYTKGLNGLDIFNQLYNDQIIELLELYPMSHVIDGIPFWSNIKKCPKIIKYDEKNQSHCDFVKVCDRLLNQTISEFEKDDDLHIEFVTLASNFRAVNYSIETTDKFTTKKIAGKIIPAIATTTALVSGLVSMEIYKIMQEKTQIEDYRNYYVNLALPMLTFSEPILNKEIWETKTFHNPLVSDIYDTFDDISCIMFDTMTLISEFMPKEKLAMRQAMNLIDLYKEVTLDNNPIFPILVTVMMVEDIETVCKIYL